MCKFVDSKSLISHERRLINKSGRTDTTPASTRRQAMDVRRLLTDNTCLQQSSNQFGVQLGSPAPSSACDHAAVAVEMGLELARIIGGSMSGHKRKAEDGMAAGEATVLGDLCDLLTFKQLLNKVSPSHSDRVHSRDAQRMAELQLLEQHVQQQLRRLQQQQQLLLESQRRNQQLIRYIKTIKNTRTTPSGSSDATTATALPRAASRSAAAAAQHSRPKLFRIQRACAAANNSAAAATTQRQVALMLESVSNEDLSQAIQQALQQQLTQQQAAARLVQVQQVLPQQLPPTHSGSLASSGSQRQPQPKAKKPKHVPISACIAPPAVDPVAQRIVNNRKSCDTPAAAAPAPPVAVSLAAQQYNGFVIPTATAAAACPPPQQLQLQQQPYLQCSTLPCADTPLSGTAGNSSSCSAAGDLPPVPAEFGTGVLRFNSSCSDLLSLLESLSPE